MKIIKAIKYEIHLKIYLSKLLHNYYFLSNKIDKSIIKSMKF